LWPAGASEKYFSSLLIEHRSQVGGTCVPTGLSLLTGDNPETVREQVNTQDPFSWSQYLSTHKMKLAYCPTDLRRLKYFIPEMLAIDDLFAIGIYSPENVLGIGREPDEKGWICGSHFILMHRDKIFDTARDKPITAAKYPRLGCYVKRIFRILPHWHSRGL
jgi:hypothetical protein